MLDSGYASCVLALLLVLKIIYSKLQDLQCARPAITTCTEAADVAAAAESLWQQQVYTAVAAGVYSSSSSITEILIIWSSNLQLNPLVD